MVFKRANLFFLSLPIWSPFSTPVAHAVLIYVLQMHSKVGSFCSRFSVKALSFPWQLVLQPSVWCSFKNTHLCQQKKNRVSDRDTLEIPLSVQRLLLQPPSLPLSVGQMHAAPVIPPSPPLKASTRNRHKFAGKRARSRDRQEIPRLMLFKTVYTQVLVEKISKIMVTIVFCLWLQSVPIQSSSAEVTH